MNPMLAVLASIKSALFLIAVFLPIVPIAALIVRIKKKGVGFRKNLRMVVVLGISLVFNPLLQFFLLEPWDTNRNYAFAKRAQDAAIVGKTPSEVKAIFGDPEYTWSQPASPEDSGYTCWEYKPLPGYWLGSHFQVVFVNGKVRNFEANDD